MKTCTVIVSHFESENFLRACVRQTLKHQHPEIESNIIIVDQSGDETHARVSEEYENVKGVRVFRTLPLYSGFGLDFLLHRDCIDTEYICQLHSDAFAISPNFLYLPIKLIEEYDLAFVGQLQFINPKDNLAHIYPPSPIFAMAQCYNVAKTSTYKELSLEAGFTRYHNRPRAEGMTWNDKSWDEWASESYNERGSDDDVVAFHWQDKYTTDNKLGLAVTNYIQPSFGRIIEGIVFHFGSARESIGVAETMPLLYQEYTKRINENFSDELIEEMVALAKGNTTPSMEILNRNYWDGKLKVSSPPSQEINNRIEQLKNT